MAKRRAGAAGLTGGTGDVNPQLYRLSVIGPTVPATTTSATTFGSATFPVPVPKFSQQNGRAIVMEILKIRWNTNLSFNFNDEATRLMSINGFLSTKSYAAPPATNDGALIDYNSGITTVSPQVVFSEFFHYRYYSGFSGFSNHA